MRFLWSIHLYPPNHNCGSEYVAHHVNQFLISRGHEVRVILHNAHTHGVKVPYTFEGVEVMPPTGNCDAYRWADVILTHLDYTQYTIIMAATVDRPLVHFIHNDIEYASITGAFANSYVVYNSKWIADKLKYRWPSMILNPPCDYEYYNVCERPEENEFITLISLNKNKGGNEFYRVAELMPDRKFLGVIGSYDEQIIRELPNVTIVPNTPDILSVYKKTRILLMPSAYESWGRTATEAMCNGIPVICTPTPGLLENCDTAGIYIPPRKEDEYYDVSEIVKEIKKLDDKKSYRKVSEKCRQRAKELNPDLNELENFLLNVRQLVY